MFEKQKVKTMFFVGLLTYINIHTVNLQNQFLFNYVAIMCKLALYLAVFLEHLFYVAKSFSGFLKGNLLLGYLKMSVSNHSCSHYSTPS
jgi:hypothetical protein